MKKKYIYNNETEFSEDQIQKIKGKLLAEKYGCSSKYVLLVLRGKRNANTETAKGIIEDARKILGIAESKPELNKEAC